jgi:hypothetical protein
LLNITQRLINGVAVVSYIMEMPMTFWPGWTNKKITNEIPEMQGWDWNDVLQKRTGATK